MVGYGKEYADIYPAYFDMTKESKICFDKTVQTHEAWIDASNAQMNGDNVSRPEKPPSPYGRIRPIPVSSDTSIRGISSRGSSHRLRGRGGRGRSIETADRTADNSNITSFIILVYVRHFQQQIDAYVQTSC